MICPLDKDYKTEKVNMLPMSFIDLNYNCKKIIFTANMSAGKSTIINAVIGKRIAKTALEVCTGNISYIYNKPFEDGHILLSCDGYTINADIEEVLSNSCDKERYISSYFNFIDKNNSRLCLIDTPWSQFIYESPTWKDNKERS